MRRRPNVGLLLGRRRRRRPTVNQRWADVACLLGETPQRHTARASHPVLPAYLTLQNELTSTKYLRDFVKNNEQIWDKTCGGDYSARVG